MNQVVASAPVGVVVALNGAGAQPVYIDHLLLLRKLLSTKSFAGVVKHPCLIFGLVVHDFSCASVWLVQGTWLQRPELFVATRLLTNQWDDLGS